MCPALTFWNRTSLCLPEREPNDSVPGRLTRTSKLWTKGAYLSGVRTFGGDCSIVFCCFAFSSEFGAWRGEIASMDEANLPTTLRDTAWCCCLLLRVRLAEASIVSEHSVFKCLLLFNLSASLLWPRVSLSFLKIPKSQS